MENLREKQEEWERARTKRAILGNGLVLSASNLIKGLKKGNISEKDFIRYMKTLIEEFEKMEGES